MTDPDRPLQGKTILVTRPANVAARLIERLQALGARCECLPLFDIEPQPAHPPADWADYDGVIFTSRNAVLHTIELMADWQQTPCLAVGPATADELRARGVGPVIVPDDTRSEGLLELPVLQDVRDQHWLIVKGAGGRRKLAQALGERGAHVDNLEVYRRLPIQHDARLMQQLLDRIDAIIIFSGEGLEHLWQLCPPALHDRLARTQLVVPAQRVVKKAQDIGFRHRPYAARRMSDQDLLTALLQALRLNNTYT